MAETVDLEKLVRPYFDGMTHTLRDLILPQIVPLLRQALPPNPTAADYQAMLTQLPDLVSQIKEQLIAVIDQQIPQSDLKDKMDPEIMFGGMLDPMSARNLTGTFSNRGRLVDGLSIKADLTYDLVTELWRFFRLNHPVPLELYPNVSHLILAMSRGEFQQHYPLYQKLTSLFLELLKLGKGCVSFVADTKLYFVSKDQDTFKVGTAELAGGPGIKQMLTTALGTSEDFGNLTFLIDCSVESPLSRLQDAQPVTSIGKH